jgi:PEP-CTERM motif
LRNLLLGGIAAIAFSGTALAGQIPSSSCSNSDLSLTIGTTIYTPVKCLPNILSTPLNPSNIVSEMNTAFGFTTPATAFKLATNWSNTTNPGTVDGIDYSITASAVTKGTFTVTWADHNPSGSLTLPIVTDFLVGLDGGSTGDGYEFTNVILPITPNSGTGTFTISFLNGGNQTPGLSGITLAVGDDVACGRTNGCDPTTRSVPEPATIAVLGTGLLGLGFIRRRAN